MLLKVWQSENGLRETTIGNEDGLVREAFDHFVAMGQQHAEYSRVEIWSNDRHRLIFAWNPNGITMERD